MGANCSLEESINNLYFSSFIIVAEEEEERRTPDVWATVTVEKQ
jgi:hypothetical protein